MRGFVFINEPHNSVKRVFMVGPNMVFINSLINRNQHYIIIYIYIYHSLYPLQLSWWYLYSELLLYRKERPTISFHQLKMIMNIIRVFKNMNINVTIYDYKLCQAWLIQRGKKISFTPILCLPLRNIAVFLSVSTLSFPFLIEI